MTKVELGKAIYQVSNVKGKFTLRSGQITHEYFDKYLFESNPLILSEIAIQMVALLPLKFDQLAGLEMGSIPIVTAMSLHTGISSVFVRKKVKKYGTCKLVEGKAIHGLEIVIIEDIVTSGGAILDAVRALRLLGAIVNHICCVIDREDSGKMNLEKASLTFSSLFTQSELKLYTNL